MKLHYSQTKHYTLFTQSMFYYHMKLHYSQTIRKLDITILEFYYHMKLHYSQTTFWEMPANHFVLLPYEITLLSNLYNLNTHNYSVLLPYEITLLSNYYYIPVTYPLSFTTI